MSARPLPAPRPSVIAQLLYDEPQVADYVANMGSFVDAIESEADEAWADAMERSRVKWANTDRGQSAVYRVIATRKVS